VAELGGNARYAKVNKRPPGLLNFKWLSKICLLFFSKVDSESRRMSFGFSITDLKEVIKLAWNLHESLKQCPQEIKDLSRDFATVHGVLNQIEHDLVAKNSAIRAHGEARLNLLNSLVLGLKLTMVELQKLVDKFRPIAADSKNLEQLWLKMKWTVGQKRVSRIRQDISYHVSSLTLLMTSMGK
jgi:hypothetical protein